PRVQRLVDRFPRDGDLAALNAVARAGDGSFRSAARELARARSLGTDPARVLPPELVAEIEKKGAPGWPERLAWTLLGFVIFYAVVMLLMAGAGLLLAGRTRGNK